MMRTRAATLALLVGGLAAAGTPPGDDALVAHWGFDETSGRVAVDSASGIEDAIGGNVERLAGVAGHALRFDGATTHVRREVARAPELDEAFTIEAWVALQAYPWNWTALVEQAGDALPRRRPVPPEPDPEHLRETPAEWQPRVVLGVDDHGRVGLKVAVEGSLRECVASRALRLLEWAHVAGTFHRDRGLRLLVDGEPVCSLTVRGAVTPARGGELLLGRSHLRLGPTGSEREPSAQTPSPMVLDGALDEVRIHTRALSPEDVAARAAGAAKPPPLEWARLPSGPAELAPRFAASYGRLRYTDNWEAPWRVGDRPDILIRFDRQPVRLVFWRGTGYGAAWVTENGLWMGDQSLERSGGTPRGTAEHMNDKQTRYSHVSLIEDHDARKVVHWRYALTDIAYGISRLGVDGGPGEWADEYYTVYPDGVATRKQVLWTDDLRHEWQETIVLHQPGTRPEDNIELEAMTLANLRGEWHRYSWAEGAPRSFDAPEDANIQLTRLKSQYRPFIVFEPRPRIKPFRAAIRPEVSHFPWWNHWPVAQLPNDGRRAMGPGRPSHSSLSQSVEDSEVIHRRDDGAFTVSTLVGLTRAPMDDLVTLARSWLQPPPLTLETPGFSSQGHDRSERAYLLSRGGAEPSAPLRLRLAASDGSPLVNPAFVIRGWGEPDVRLQIDGETVPPGGQLRVGRRRTLQGTDLVVWLERVALSPLEIRIAPVAPPMPVALPASRERPASNRPASGLRLPSGPRGAVRFGAYPTRLAYEPAWDREWRVDRYADLVVRFDAAEPRFVLWRGTSYVPCWATADGPWFTSGFFERRGGPTSGTTSMVEPLSDKQARYSHYRILEASDARVVIHWRYAPVDLDYAHAFVDPETGWGDWADEVYTIYPDGVAARRATLRSSALDAWREPQETILVNLPGTAPEDGLERAALTLANARGESRTYSWTEDGAPPLADPPPGASIEVVQLRSRLHPFTIVPPDGARFASYPGHAPGSRFNAWSHWPVARERSDASVGIAPDKPSHTSLSHVSWKPYASDEASVTWVMLQGMSDQPVAGIARLARSWLSPPELELKPGPCHSRGYDPAQRAYVLRCPRAATPEQLAFELLASEARPLHNAAFVVEGWGRARASLHVVDRALPPETARFGWRDALDGSDLIVWLRADATRPTRVTLAREPSAAD